MLAKPIKENLALFSSCVLLLVAGVRIYAFTEFNLQDSLAVLSVVDYFKLLFSSLIYIMVTFLPYALIAFVFIRSFREWLLGYQSANEKEVLVRITFMTLPFLIVALVSLSGFMASVLLILIATFLIRKYIDYRRRKAGKMRHAGSFDWKKEFQIAPVIVVLLFSFVVMKPWVPLENLEISSDEMPVVGYIIGDSGDKTLIVSENKNTRWIDTDSIDKRTICENRESWITRPLYITFRDLIAPPEQEEYFSKLSCQKNDR